MISKDRDVKLGYEDVAIKPSELGLNSRSEPQVKDKNGKYPIFISPMAQLTDGNNVELFNEQMYPVIPRSVDLSDRYKLCTKYWTAFAIKDELHELDYFFDTDCKFGEPKYICLDCANGHMPKLFEIGRKLKDKFSNLQLMGGNFANPYTIQDYMTAGFDYVRTSIGSGSQCTTAILTGVYYPPVSLIDEACKIRDEFYKKNPHLDWHKCAYTKIVADGGIHDFGTIMKALVAGADYVMIGQMAAEILECCSAIFRKSIRDKGFLMERKHGYELNMLLPEDNFYRKFYGMSTRTAQEDFGKSDRVHAEGIHSMVKIKYTLKEFYSRLDQAIRSSMTYHSKYLVDLKKVTLIRISPSARNAFVGDKMSKI